MQNISPPRPGVLLILCAVVVIAASFTLMGVAIAACSKTWDAMSIIGGVILLPLPTTLCLQQYFAVVCREGKAARIACLMLLVVGGFATLFAIGTAVEFFIEAFEVPWTMLLIVLAVAFVSLGAAWANYRWFCLLSERDVTPSRVGRREWLAGLAALVVTLTLSALLVSATPPRFAEHVQYDVPPFGIPTGATDISYCQGIRGTIAYEFAIDEPGFRRWVNDGVGTLQSRAADTELLAIKDPFTITRYNRLASELDGPEFITISRGLYYEWFEGDRGVYAALDQSTGRAYYYRQSH